MRYLPLLHEIKVRHGKHGVPYWKMDHMEIERLSFIVTPQDRVEDFIDSDAAVWDPWLRQQRGYLRKTYQRYPNGRVDLRLFWATKKDLIAASKSPEIPALDVRHQSSFLGVYQRLP
jgi:hypothetical protein